MACHWRHQRCGRNVAGHWQARVTRYLADRRDHRCNLRCFSRSQSAAPKAPLSTISLEYEYTFGTQTFKRLGYVGKDENGKLVITGVMSSGHLFDTKTNTYTQDGNVDVYVDPKTNELRVLGEYPDIQNIRVGNFKTLDIPEGAIALQTYDGIKLDMKKVKAQPIVPFNIPTQERITRLGEMTEEFNGK